MAKVADIQTTFSGGEASDLVQGRVDADLYATILDLCLNYVPLLQGPILRRPGTKFVAPTKSAGGSAPMLMRFEFSTTQAYIIELGNQYARFYKDNAAILLTAQNITGITQANPAVVTYSGADTYANGDEVEISGVLGMTQVNGRRFTVANVNAGANTFELSGVNSTGYTAYSSGGTVAEVYEIATPYLTADLFQLKFAQSADVLYITHPSYAPRKLTRTGHTAWTLTEIDFLDGPFLPTNATTTTLTLSGTTGSVTVTASAALFASTDVGRLIRWRDPANNWTWLEITAFTSTTVVTATIRGPNASAGTATTSWRLGVWSDTTGYPAAVTFHDDRLWFGGATSYPQRVDGSNVGDYENFAPSAANGTVGDANACAFTLNSTDVQNIRWMRSDEKGLLIGTVKAEWVLRPSADNQAITPTNVSAKPSTKHGSANIDPVEAGKATLFVQRAKRKLREMIYALDEDGFGAPDLTQLAEHITTGGFIQLCYQQEPYSIVWGCRADGTLLSMTYERSVDSLSAGWAGHVLGGTGTAGGGQPVVESVAAIPSADGTRDEVWMVVKRYIGGQTVRYVEYMTKFFDDDDDATDQFFLDCGATYSGASASTIGGLWHLEGQTVSALVNGAVVPNEVVANGQITVDVAGTKIQVGYAYNSDARTVRPNAGAANGTAMGKTKRAHRVGFLFFRTGGFKFGRDFNNLDEMTFRTTATPMDQAVALFSGIKSQPFNGGYDMDAQVCWRQSQPLNGAILAVFPQYDTQDRI